VAAVRGALVLACALAACTQPAVDRAERDLGLGAVETKGYRFESHEGLLHVREATAERLELRASCDELSMTLSRKDTSLGTLVLEISNVLPSLELAAAPGVLSAPSVGPAPLTTTWVVTFPADADRVMLTTPPRSGDFTFLAFGDIQNGIRTFSDVVAKLNEEPEADFILFLGDLTESTQPEQFDAVDAVFAQVKFPVFATPGNHDVQDNAAYQRRYGRTSYSCTHKGARFTAIDSSSALLAGELWPRLSGWLDLGRPQTHVLFSHIPATEVLGVRSGQWDSRTEARRFTASAVEGDVDLMLFGHIHSFDAYELGGIPAYISGGGGAIPERFDGIDRHFLRVRVSSGQVGVEVVRVDP
jgi:predicted phosphodiesterase